MLYLVPLIIVFCLVAQDANVADYLYLKLFREFPLQVRMSAMRFRMRLGLAWDAYRMKRGHIPKRFMKMAAELQKRD